MQNLERGDNSYLPETVVLSGQEVRSDALDRRRERKKRVTETERRRSIYRGRLTDFLINTM